MDEETEEVIGLSNRTSALGQGHKNHIVLQATVNVCAESS